MNLQALYDAIGTLGMPVAVAAFLIWHFVSMNKSLTVHNKKLISEIAALRKLMERATISEQTNARLLQQNEKLVEAVQDRERQSQELLRQLIEARFLSPPEGGE